MARSGLNPGQSGRTWRTSEKALWRTVLGDVVVVSVEGDGPPFALSGGARLWQLLDRPRTLADLTEVLGAAGSQEAELGDLLASLGDAGVVETAAR